MSFATGALDESAHSAVRVRELQPYQLNWAISFFAHADLPGAADWVQPLREAVDQDGIRILEYRLPTPNVVQFLVSTKPPAALSFAIQRLKGRLQYILRDRLPKAFRRNYRLESVGSANREVIEAYVQNQVAHHPMADSPIQKGFEWVQIVAEDEPFALGCGVEDAPESVTLCLLNNLAYAHGVKEIYRRG